jgi:hypothetical protein
MASTITLYEYMKDVERWSGLSVSTTFPASPSDEQQIVLDAINATLSEINIQYYLTFMQTTYTLTTSAGTSSYNLAESPYSQSYWRVHRLAQNGVRRVTDDFPLKFVPYNDLDYYSPVQTSRGHPVAYSSYGKDLIIFPPADGSQLKVRYYGTHIGTDDSGDTQKMKLTESTDLVLLDDEYRWPLIWGASCKTRMGTGKVDEKYFEFENYWTKWCKAMVDMMQPGEDAAPEMVLDERPSQGLNRYATFFRRDL